jgi:TonB family protein
MPRTEAIGSINRFCILIVVMVALVSSVNSAANSETATQVPELLDQALKREYIWAAGAPSVELRAKLELALEKGKVAIGDYTRLWVSPSQSREEINFANFNRTRVRQANGYWQKRSIDYEPEAIFQIERILNLKSVLELSAGEWLGKKGDKKGGATSITCVEVKRGEQIDRKLCFDQTQGVLVSVDYPTHPHIQPPEISRVEYSDFTALESYIFPGRIRALSGRKTVAAFTVVKFAKIENLNPASFGNLQGAQFWQTCGDDLQKWKLLNSVQPEYPADARAKHVQGRVAFFAVIEVDGSLSQITLIHPAAPELEKAAFQAISQWRYQPSTCVGVPIRVETMISTDFSLDL